MDEIVCVGGVGRGVGSEWHESQPHRNALVVFRRFGGGPSAKKGGDLEERGRGGKNRPRRVRDEVMEKRILGKGERGRRPNRSLKVCYINMILT